MHRRSFLKIAAASAGGIALMGGYAVISEPSSVAVNRYRLAIPRLPAAFEGFTIVQITDLHYGFFIHLDLIRRIVAQVNDLPHDITICTGDYISNTAAQAEMVWPLINGLRAPGGVYSILGNHDYRNCYRRSIELLERSGQSLRHRNMRLERDGQPLWLAGTGDLWFDHKNIDVQLDAIPADECRIVLTHNPDSADTIHRQTADLVIAGHTHGGQVNLPLIGSPIVSVDNRDYTSGLRYSKRGVPVFISRGIGMARIPLRVNCPPEIAVLELTREISAAA
jgi:predicted MPP superfamily phosphohydrolase